MSHVDYFGDNLIVGVFRDQFMKLPQPQLVAFVVWIDPGSNCSLDCYKTAGRVDYYFLKHFLELLVSRKKSMEYIYTFFEGEFVFKGLKGGVILLKNNNLFLMVNINFIQLLFEFVELQVLLLILLG